MQRAGGEKRGSCHNRRARKLWMLRTWNPELGPDHCRCVHAQCGHSVLTYETVEADRIVPGGSYKRTNVQPSCHPCNVARSNNAAWIPRVLAA
jgi:hypothetical protein